MNMPDYHDLLLKEYSEAGSQCRSCEQLIRTSVSVSVPILLALIGLILSPLPGHLLKLGLSFAGSIVCLVFLNTIYREKAYYHYYLERAKEIEKLFIDGEKQILSVYTKGEEVKKKVPYTISNKHALSIVLWIAFASLLLSSVYYGATVWREYRNTSSAAAISYVPDQAAAIQIAVAVWNPIYGKEKIQKEKPFKAILRDGVWHVSGNLPKGRMGGVAEAEISKTDGRIIRISHSQ
jgi:hypothetical protein